MKRFLVSLAAVAMTALTLVFAPSATAAGSDTTCIHLVQAVQSVSDPQALPESSLLWQCSVVPGA